MDIYVSTIIPTIDRSNDFLEAVTSILEQKILPDELGIDPIYTHKKGKSIVNNQEELGLALDRDIDAKTMQSLHDFSQDFYTPLDVSALLKLL